MSTTDQIDVLSPLAIRVRQPGRPDELYAASLQVAAAALNDDTLLARADDAPHHAGPVLVQGDELFFAEDDWLTLRNRVLHAGHDE
ncbi:MAG TPA: hypothetical protein VNJ02_17745 [Vicinamibacterales bacterium]|nr:hypothetical protein [Vicinamibacterales bacterium]